MRETAARHRLATAERLLCRTVAVSTRLPHEVAEHPVRLCAAHGPWLQQLTTRFEIVWATAWGAKANRLLAPLLGLPELPVVGFPPIPFDPREKLPAVATYVGDRAVAWIDDALPPEAHNWAAGRDISTLLISVDPVEGLTRRVVDQALEWADTLASLDVMPHTPSSNR